VQLGSAIEFDRSFYFTIPNPILLMDEFTIALWIKTNDSAGRAGWQWWEGARK
jgi:hypothetical protein